MLNKLIVLFSNVDTFNIDKLHEIRARLALLDSKPHITALSEVKPKNFKFERDLSEYTIERYEIIPMNLKKDDKGRGMLLYILDSVKYIQVEMNTQFQEYICVAIELKRSEKLLFTSIYRSPTSTDENTLQLNNLLRKISNTKYTHKLAVRDFNYPGVN